MNEKMNLKEEETYFFFKKKCLTVKGEKNIKENIIKSQVPRGIDFLEKLVIVHQGPHDEK